MSKTFQTNYGYITRNKEKTNGLKGVVMAILFELQVARLQ